MGIKYLILPILVTETEIKYTCVKHKKNQSFRSLFFLKKFRTKSKEKELVNKRMVIK